MQRNPPAAAGPKQLRIEHLAPEQLELEKKELRQVELEKLRVPAWGRAA